MHKRCGVLLAAILVGLIGGSSLIRAQQLGSGHVLGNPSASQAPARDATLSQMFDRAFSTSPGDCIVRGVSVWASGSCGGGGAGTPGGSNTYVQFNTAGSFGGNIAFTWLAPALSIGATGSTTGQLKLLGTTSGTITIQPQDAAGTYNFNLPTSAGSSGQPLLSGGGATNPMAFGTLGVAGGGTGLTGGTSGGIPYFSGTSTIASSGLLTATRVLLGGGAGAAPNDSANLTFVSPILAIGVAGSTTGQLQLAGATSGFARVTAQATAGTPVITLPNASGTTVVSCSSPLSCSATTGAASITGGQGTVLAGITPAFTGQPILGIAGSTTGLIGFENAVSGRITVQPPAGPLGTTTLFWPAPATTAVLTYTVNTGTKALATSSISSAACTSAQTATATGVQTTDSVIATFATDVTSTTGYLASTSGMLTIIAYPTADTVNFKVCNLTSASITPGGININWRVVR